MHGIYYAGNLNFLTASTGCHNKSADLILVDKMSCVKAAWLLKTVHQDVCGNLSWDAKLAEVCAKWLITEYIDAYRKSITYRPHKCVTKAFPNDILSRI